MSNYLALTLDPLHIGAGGYRLGRVDNTIVRDAGTGLPKVPGSSLAGAARCYAGWVLENNKQFDFTTETTAKDEKGNPITIIRESADIIFGYAAGGTKEDKGKFKKLNPGLDPDKYNKQSSIGLLRFYDGCIVAFPVRTMAGPVWVTCPSVLGMYGVELAEKPGNEELLINFDLESQKLNIGWLYLPAKKLQNGLDLKLDEKNKAVVSRFAVAPDWLFTEIVNSNLEVRTSVCIDPETGAAKEGALFTYEAIPAATLLAFDIELDEQRCPDSWPAEKVREVLQKALASCETLGMGGMTTRGFGRLRFIPVEEK